MFVYLIGFFAFVLLVLFAQKVEKKQRKWINSLAILIPCLIAGLRADTIGSDVKGYLSPLINLALNSSSFSEYLNSSWFRVWQNIYVSDFEIGFTLLVYIIANIFKNIFAVQFAIQLLTITPIYYVIKNRSNKEYTWVGYFAYFFLLYNTSLNMMRQSIAMAFAFLAWHCFVNKKNKKCVFFLCIGFLFHTSALLGAIPLIAHRFIYAPTRYTLAAKSNNTVFSKKAIILCLTGICILPGIQIIVAILKSIGLSKYVGYISGALSFMPNQIIVRLPIVVLFLIHWKRLKAIVPHIYFYIVMLVYDIVCSQLTSANQFNNRIAMYFSMFYMLLLPEMCFASRNLKLGRKRLNFTAILIVAYLLFYWCFYFVYKGVSETVPYIIGI